MKGIYIYIIVRNLETVSEDVKQEFSNIRSNFATKIVH
jgi:hypothetical protein